MYQLTLAQLNPFVDVYHENSCIEYHQNLEYDIIIDGSPLNYMHQPDKNNDYVCVWFNDSTMRDMHLTDKVNVIINRIIRKEIPEHTIIKMTIANAIGCLCLDMLERYSIKAENLYEFRINKFGKKYNTNIDSIKIMNHEIFFNEDDSRFDVCVKLIGENNG